MKALLNLKQIFLAITLTVAPHFAFAGGTGPGGGFYGKVNGHWILIDDLEQGKIIHPEKEGFFKSVEEILIQIEQKLPELAKDLRVPLAEKTWHLVPFEILCEDPKSHIQVETAAGACQDDNDIFIEEAKFKVVAKDQLILHELVQGRRLLLNKERKTEDLIPPASVRGLKRVLTAVGDLEEMAFSSKVSKYGFGNYQTFSSIKREEQAKAPIEKKINDAQDLFFKNCNGPITDIGPALQAWEALNEAYREASWVAVGSESNVSFSFRDWCNLKKMDLNESRNFCMRNIQNLLKK
ncbi:MAG: hypothetical protein SGJ18_08300 [Pseudomonadota bacterium]|nr:hypothetical protein [Pseudomonadota bacterium]